MLADDLCQGYNLVDPVQTGYQSNHRTYKNEFNKYREKFVISGSSSIRINNVDQQLCKEL
jgi:hypothetical protein